MSSLSGENIYIFPQYNTASFPNAQDNVSVKYYVAKSLCIYMHAEYILMA